MTRDKRSARKQARSAAMVRQYLQPIAPGKPVWIDSAIAQLARLTRVESHYGNQDEENLTQEIITATGWDEPRSEEGEAAWNGLCEIAHALDDRGRMLAEELPSAAWLWYLRRMPWLWEGINNLETTGAYVAAIADSLSARSAATSPEPTRTSFGLSYPITANEVRRVLRLRSVAVLLYDIHGALRWAGKGARVESAPGRMPRTDQGRDLRRFVRLWDKRVAEAVDAALLARAGLYIRPSRTLEAVANLPGIVPAVGHAGAAYGLATLPLGRVPFLGDAAVPAVLRWPRPLVDLIVLMWSLLLSEALREKLEVGLLPFKNTGYRVLARPQLEFELDKALWFIGETRLGAAIPDEVALGAPKEIDRLLSWPASIWPPRVPPLRETNDGIAFVDYAAATRLIADTLARPAVTGSTVNVWSDHFERDVQRAIDETRWRPSAEVANTRGRHLRIEGEAVTNVDAIGERNGTLLLVSAKAVPFTDELDRGEYLAVTRLARKVTDDVGAWEQRVGKLDATRKGDNYDFTPFRRLVGVVVYPSPPWTTSAVAVREVAGGLRAASSTQELERWCRGSKW